MKSASRKLLSLVAAALTSSALSTTPSAVAGHGGSHGSHGGGSHSSGGGSSMSRSSSYRSQGNGGNYTAKSAKLDPSVKPASGVQSGSLGSAAKSKVLTSPNTKVDKVGKLPGGVATNLPTGNVPTTPSLPSPKDPGSKTGKIPFPGGKLPTTPNLPGPKDPKLPIPGGKIPFPGGGKVPTTPSLPGPKDPGKIPFPGGKNPLPGNPGNPNPGNPPKNPGDHADHHHHCHPCWTHFCWPVPVVVLEPCEPVIVTEVVREVVMPREVALAQPADLQIADIRLLDAGNAARQAGPTYRLTVRNNSLTAVAQPFDVVLMAAAGEKPSETSPYGAARVEGLAGGASREVDVRLPVDVFQMGLSAEGQPLSYASLFAAADANQEVTESNEANNALAVARTAVPAAEAVAAVSP